MTSAKYDKRSRYEWLVRKLKNPFSLTLSLSFRYITNAFQDTRVVSISELVNSAQRISKTLGNARTEYFCF